MRILQGVVPDIVTLGKAMGNGYPIAGLVVRNATAEAFAAGPKYFNTFAGNNVACASALAVLRALSQQRLQRNAADVGAHLMQGLARLRGEFAHTVGDVRGHGLFIGVEIVQSQHCKAHAPGKAAWLQEELKRQQVCRAHRAGAAACAWFRMRCARSAQCKRVVQVLMSVDGRFENVLKIKPPLVFSMSDADRLLTCLHEALRRMAAAPDEVAALHKRKMASIEPGQAQAQAYFARKLPEL